MTSIDEVNQTQDSNLQRCDAGSLGEKYLIFRRIILHSSSGSRGPRRTAVWDKSVYYIKIIAVDSGWPKKVVNQ
jgi:hypothetical protein